MSTVSVRARNLVAQFLKYRFGTDCGNTGLKYYNGRFYRWESGCYYETPEEEIKTGFTVWAGKNAHKDFDNSKRNADEAVYHIKAKVFLHTKVLRDSFIDGSQRTGRYVAFENGIVNILEASAAINIPSIIEHTPNFFNFAKIPYAFNAKARCPTWAKIITQILPEREDQQLLQQWFGYNLMPGLSRSKMMFFEGQGANGKSVVLLVLRLMLGEENVSSIPLSAFDPDKTFKMASTDGKLANICEEAGQVSVRVEEALKQYVTGAVFTVERKFENPYQMYPSAKLTVATNDIPQFKDRSDGIWRRILYLKFAVTIEPHLQRREYLDRTFWLGADELPGILRWALSGALNLESSNQFLNSDRKQDEVGSLKMNSDLIRSWVADNFAAEPKFNQPTSEILIAMKRDIDDGLLPRISQRDLFREIEAQFPKAHRPQNAVMIAGRRARVISGIKMVLTHQTQVEST